MKDHWGYDELLNLLEYIKVAGIDKRPTPADKEFRDAVRDLIKMVRDKIDPADWARFGAEHHDREGNRLPEGETVRLEDDAGQPYPFHNYQNAVVDKLLDVQKALDGRGLSRAELLDAEETF